VVLEDVEVLGNDRSIMRGPAREASMTSVVALLVTPEDAEKLTVATTEGHLHLVLRSVPEGRSVVKMLKVTTPP
jgi:pilus assembly protein CpaB